MAVKKLGDVLKKLPLVFRQDKHYFDAREARIIRNIPTKKGGSVNYAVVLCGCGCKTVKIAPKENFFMCIDEHIEKMKALLKENNFSIL